jgi:serine/alanine adding enzyme
MNTREVIEGMDSLESLYGKLKAEKQNKGEIAKQFKGIVKDSPEFKNLVSLMQDVSLRIQAIEAEIKVQISAPTEENLSPHKTQKLPFTYIEQNQLYAQSFSIQTLTGEDFAKWDHFLLTQDHTSYHKSAWFKLLANTFNKESIIIVARDEENKIIGGIPLTFFSSALFGKFAISIPYVNYGGPVTRYYNIAQALINHTKEVRLQKNLSHIEIRTMQSGLAANALDKKVSMVLALPESDEELERQLGAKVRAQYKKAEAFQPSFKVGKLELLNDFYAVFSRNMRDLGTPVYSKQWFANILNEDSIKSSLIVVYMNHQPVSTGFLLAHQNTLEIPWASTIQSANLKNANMWMYRQVLCYAIKEGYSFFDFGRSTLGAGTYKFKKQWGATAYSHYWYYLLPDGQSKPELNPDNPKYKLIIFLWKLIPVWLTQLIGPHLIKHIP